MQGIKKCSLIDREVAVSLAVPGTVISFQSEAGAKFKMQLVNVKEAQKSNLKWLRAVNSRL